MAVEMDVEVAAGIIDSRTNCFCLKYRMESWRPGAILFLLVKVLDGNVVRDPSVSQISMLTAWELNAGVNVAHELLTPGKLCCPIKHRNQGKTDGRKLLESELG